jgi:hypothetical protein
MPGEESESVLSDGHLPRERDTRGVMMATRDRGRRFVRTLTVPPRCPAGRTIGFLLHSARAGAGAGGRHVKAADPPGSREALSAAPPPRRPAAPHSAPRAPPAAQKLTTALPPPFPPSY